IYATVRRACRLAREGAPGPVFVEIPADLYLFRHEFDRRAGAPIHVGPAAAPAPAAPEVERAAALLGGSRRPLLYLGLGAAGAGRELVRLAERLEAAVATTIQGKGVFPESHPLFLWPGFGDAAPAFVREIVGGCDATLAIGCRFGEVATGSYGLVPPAPLIHVDIDPAVIGRNYPVELGIVADAGLFVGALLERLEVGLGPKPETSERAGRGAGRGAVKGRRPGAEAVWLGDVVAGAADKAGTGSGSGSDLRRRTPDRAMRERIQQGHEEVWAEWLGEKAERRVSPARLMRGLQEHFGADAIFTTDSGNGTFLATELLRLDRPGKLLAPVDYSCMGYAVPAAVGAKLACSEAPVIALAGDGAFLMTGLELLTAAHHSVAIAVLVLRDRELAQIAQFQSVALNRKACSELADYDLAGLSRAVGVECLPLDRDEEIPAALAEVERILAGGRPVVVDVAIDYSRKTYFTRGVVKTNFLRLPWPDRLRFIGRALGRRLRA
ncbi:MAG: thiamine pyrophosphate-binding protein, partial [Gemmatimonadetes bacterium]|nr:thiamine pyrophosphate-binding protein [Gemmatimonadota bacterium]